MGLFRRKPKPSLSFVDPTMLATGTGQAAQAAMAMAPVDPSSSAFPTDNPPSYGGFPGGGATYGAFPPIVSNPAGPVSSVPGDFGSPGSYGGFPAGPSYSGFPGVTPAPVAGTDTSSVSSASPVSPGPIDPPTYSGFPSGGTALAPTGSPGDANPAELTPIEGHPGQFTDGHGKGGGDDVNGSMQYGVYDANGKFLGWNETVHINGATTNYGYSYGSDIPSSVNIPGSGVVASAPADGGTSAVPAPPTYSGFPAATGGESDVVDRWVNNQLGHHGGYMDPGAPVDKHGDGQLAGTGHTIAPSTPAVAPEPVVASAAPAPAPVPTTINTNLDDSDVVDRWMAGRMPGTRARRIEVTIDSDGTLNNQANPIPSAPASIVPINVPTLPPQDSSSSPPPTIAGFDPSASASGNIHRPGRFEME